MSFPFKTTGLGAGVLAMLLVTTATRPAIRPGSTGASAANLRRGGRKAE